MRNNLFNDLLYGQSIQNICISADKNNIFTTKNLANDIANNQATIGKEPFKHFLLYSENSYDFLVGLLALIGLGKNIHLPQNFTKELLIQNSSKCQAVVTDNDNIHLNHCKTIKIKISEKSPLSHPIFDFYKSAKLFLHTSGSTAAPKVIKKNISNILDEIFCLESILPSNTKQATIISTVSHQHIYGLLFKILWPTLTGRTFVIESLLFPNEIAEQVSNYKKSVIVSSPAHLTRLPELLDLSEWKDKVSLITSSGGPLPFDAAQVIKHNFGHAPLEIYGSTETGGIAHRIQKNVNAAWVPFPNLKISVSQNGTLTVDSPFIASKNALETEDLIILNPDNTFHLRGRRDRIIKIEEKRISLPEMEEKIKGQQFVQDCVIIAIPSSNASNRITLGALVEIKNKTIDEQQLKADLIDLLKSSFENIAIPKSWRFIEKIPVNQQSKKNQLELLKFFKSDCVKPDFELISHESISENEVILTCIVPKEYIYFRGHFPDFPILPGIAQIHSIVKYCKQFFAITKNPNCLANIKFKNIIFPNDSFRIKLLRNTSANTVSFTFINDDKILASGNISFPSPETDEA